jgi:hypothetical protein
MDRISNYRKFQSSSYRLVSTHKIIGKVNFRMKILATMGQLCTEMSPESNNHLVKSLKFDQFSLFSDRSVHN